ncbi:MAG TPA: phosphoribosyltransferase family protein, partial [Solirubrobacteraceae bacterium]|nr:phosphoribosyltransferase family protein [Solirubrobacteraceae bacterium]
GELVALTPDGVAGSWRAAPPAPRRLCVFEHVYLSRRDSRADGEPLEAVRERLGERLALESPADADAVVPVPASGVPAGRGFARAAGVPLREALVRNEYVGRSFIQPTPALRELAVRMKFNVAGDLSGQRVVVVDDSIVRGSTMRHVVALLRGAGAREVHVRIAAPPVVAACHYGVDIGAPGELLAAHRRFDAVRDAIGATSLEYLSVAGLRAAVGTGARRGVCDACLTRREPAAAPAAA